MKFFAAALTAAVASANNVFLNHVAEFALSYGTIEEYNFRMAQFQRTHDLIEEHNATESSYKLGHNKMSTWTAIEYKRLLGRAKTGLKAANNEEHHSLAGVKAPASVDWRKSGAVTPPKDQGQCGSCWSFSSTGMLEGIWKIQGNKLTSFSEQQLMDCDYNKRKNNACNGGLPLWAFQYYTKGSAQGMTESDYPYKAKKGTCAYNKNKATNMFVASQGTPKSNNVASMQKAVAVAPVAVGVDASKFSFQAYKSGVFSKNCGTDLDHATLVVGYGNDKASGMDYWIMKNSWGSSWGESGYMRLVQNGDGPGQCGIQNDANFATTGSA